MPLAFTLGRLTPAAPSIAIFLTFLAAGFWHRAAWTFVLFGLLHGLVLALELRLGKPIRQEGPIWRRRLLTIAARIGACSYPFGSAICRWKTTANGGRRNQVQARWPLPPTPRHALSGKIGLAG
jgi:hypothetical protein